MGSVPIETFSIEEKQLDIEDSSPVQRAEWVLNSPDPPPLCHELISSIKKTLFPHGKKHSSSSKKQTPRDYAASFLQGLFPILRWGRNYKASKFKSDLMAGLTLASLSIPQVYTKVNPSCLLTKLSRTL